MGLLLHIIRLQQFIFTFQLTFPYFCLIIFIFIINKNTNQIFFIYLFNNTLVSKWRHRLQDLITCICITSIFYDENGKIGQVYDKSKMPLMEDYDYIFTLNYIEFWDDEHRCIHLHGKIDLSKLCDKKASILVSAGGMNYKEYAKAVDNIRKTNSVIEFYPNDIVFAPSEVEKDKLVCVTGISPSNRLYPADDLFLYRAKELYADLDLVDELDVFGILIIICPNIIFVSFYILVQNSC